MGVPLSNARCIFCLSPVYTDFTFCDSFINSLPKENVLYSLDRRFACTVFHRRHARVFHLKTCEKYEKFEYPTFVAIRLTGMFVSLSKDCAARIFSVTI